jgi:hypothetical protein
MRRLNAGYTPPSLSMFDGFGATYYGISRPEFYVRISVAYRSHIQTFFEHPYVPTHQFVFDAGIQIGCAEIRIAGNGELIGLIENLAIPSASTNWEEVNANA